METTVVVAGYFRADRYRHAKRDPRLKDRSYLTAPAGGL